MIANSVQNSNTSSISQLKLPKSGRSSSFLAGIQKDSSYPLSNFAKQKITYLNPRMSGMTNNSFKRGKKIPKHIQPLWIFFINLLIACIISLQNIYLIYGRNQGPGKFILVGFIGLVMVISVVNSLYIVDYKTLLKMYFMMDNILLAQLTADIGLVGTYLVASTGKWEEYALMFGIPISFFFFVGNFRVCVRYSNWKKWRIIPYKISLMIGAICFFQIGAYFMTVNYSYSGGVDSALDSKIKDFILLYAFGTFDFFMQLFGKISDFDQTSQLKYVYEFKEQRQILSSAGSASKI